MSRVGPRLIQKTVSLAIALTTGRRVSDERTEVDLLFDIFGRCRRWWPRVLAHVGVEDLIDALRPAETAVRPKQDPVGEPLVGVQRERKPRLPPPVNIQIVAQRIAANKPVALSHTTFD